MPTAPEVQLCTQLELPDSLAPAVRQALVHPSYAYEHGLPASNQRLEFLGDAVLQLVVSDELYRRFTSLPEGQLTRLRAAVVCEPALARAAAGAGLGQFLLLGRGEAATGGRQRASTLADAFEALIGAVYAGAGWTAARALALRLLAGELATVSPATAIDYKSLLQELVQGKNLGSLQYSVTSASGPDHDKEFRVAVTLNGRELAEGSGKSKKQAEQQAARVALGSLQSE